MGQYYNAVIEINGEKEVYYHQVDGEYMLAKLMEHSYWANPFVLAIASKLWRNKGRIAWVGDYADETDFNWNDAFKDAHTDIAKKDLEYNGFRLEGKLFINHTKKMIIDLDEYKELLKDIDMIINPIPLLTAVGNNKGGGDFHSGKGFDLVGTWAWDVIEITEDKKFYDYKYNHNNRQWDKTLKNELSDYVDVTEDYLFIED